MIYRRGSIWWFKFVFHGSVIRESTGLTNKDAARQAEEKRHLELRTAAAGITMPVRVPIFRLASEQYLKGKRPDWAPKTYVIESTNLSHLEPAFGNRLLSDIDHKDVGEYRSDRVTAGAAPKTVSLELGTLRALFIYHDLDATWARIKKKVKLARAQKIGRVITVEEESTLLSECRRSRSRSLYVAIVVALETCMRYSEIRLLRWQQIDLTRRVITVGDSKTEAGEGRVIPMSRLLYETLTVWADAFPARKLDHFVFPQEKYGQNGSVYAVDVTRPIGTWKYAWRDARKRAGVNCRFHDLRHTGCTRMLDAGVSHPVVAEIMGWSTSTAIRMIKEVYGHISLDAKKRAIEQRETFMQAETARQAERAKQAESPLGWSQNRAQSPGGKKLVIQ